jgi:hypothetical protein
MKARTKAQKRLSRKGRPPEPGVLRTAEGRKSRCNEAKSSEEKLMLEVATWKRRQINPQLTVEEARKPEHGSVIDKWLSDYERLLKRFPDEANALQFTRLHYDTAVRYHQTYERWKAVVGARRQRSASDFTSIKGYDGADPFDKAREEREVAIEQAFKEARRAVMESVPLGMMALEAIVVENQPAETLRGDLRLALNRLSVLWKMQEAA